MVRLSVFLCRIERTVTALSRQRPVAELGPRSFVVDLTKFINFIGYTRFRSGDYAKRASETFRVISSSPDDQPVPASVARSTTTVSRPESRRACPPNPLDNACQPRFAAEMPPTQRVAEPAGGLRARLKASSNRYYCTRRWRRCSQTPKRPQQTAPSSRCVEC